MAANKTPRPKLHSIQLYNEQSQQVLTIFKEIGKESLLYGSFELYRDDFIFDLLLEVCGHVPHKIWKDAIRNAREKWYSTVLRLDRWGKQPETDKRCQIAVGVMAQEAIAA